MATLKEIGNRIKSIKNTQQITKTMQMVAASRFKKSESLFRKAKEYGNKIDNLAKTLSGSITENITSPLFEKRDVKNVCLTIVTSDRGLCGSYNTNIIRKAELFLRKKKDESKTTKLVLVGKKGYDFFKNKNVSIEKSFLDLGGKVDVEAIGKVASFLPDFFISGEVDEVYLLYTHYKSPISYVPTLEKFLNLEKELDEGSKEKEQGPSPDYILEPNIAEILEDLLPQYIKTKILHSISESFISENSARMIAMKNATDNAGEMIEDMTRIRNKARQASITTEILEIVAGAEALK